MAALRRVQKSGNGLHVNLPSGMVRVLGLARGDWLWIELLENNLISLRKIDLTNRPDLSEFLPSNLIKKYDDDRDYGAKR